MIRLNPKSYRLTNDPTPSDQGRDRQGVARGLGRGFHQKGRGLDSVANASRTVDSRVEWLAWVINLPTTRTRQMKDAIDRAMKDAIQLSGRLALFLWLALSLARITQLEFQPVR